jgi:2-phosphoglycolate phosphatase
MSKIRTVLFDLDGTLIDTAPDMAAALDKLCAEENQTILPFKTVRPVVSNGSVALVKLAFGDNVDEKRLEHLKSRYLEIYEQDIAVDSCLFEGIETVFQYLNKNQMNWGVVTNKPGWLTLPLMKALKLDQEAACIVSGDSTENRKPHPEPMHYACELADSTPEECIYIGDARRDIEAGHNAGMKTIIANYGYIEEHENVNDWGANASVDSPTQIIEHLNN